MALRYNKWWATDYAFDPIDVEFGPLVFPGDDAGYTPPAWNAVDFDFVLAYTPPTPGECSVDMAADVGSSQTLYVSGIAPQGDVGTPVQVAWRKYIEPPSLGLQVAFGTARTIDRVGKNLDFVDGYSPPVFNAVSFSWGAPGGTRELLPDGLDALAFGATAVGHKNRYVDIETYGINQSGIGTAAVVNETVNLYPTGIDGFNGFGFGGDGDGAISFLDRSLNPAGIDQAALGGPVVTNQHRYVDLASYGIVAAYGTALVAYSERQVYPTFIWAFASGTPLVGTRRYLEATGIEPGIFGLQYVHDNRQYPMPPGLDATLWGMAEVTRSPRILYPDGIALRDLWPSEQWGIQTVWNKTQYLGQIFNPGSEDGGVFGSYIWTLVENRNRVIFQYGHKDSAFGPHASVNNNAVPLLPEGISTPLGVPMVAYAIRRVYLDGIEPSWFSPYNALYNSMREIAPSSISAGGIGQPWLENTRRYFQFYGFDASLLGEPFVAMAVRYVQPPLGPEGFHGYHQVQLAKRYLYPTGFELPTQFGGPNVDERFTIFRPSSILAKPMGEPFIWNATPEIRPMWIFNTEWGDTRVRHQYRHVYPEGLLQTQMGWGAISDRKITVIPTGFSALRWGTGLTVRNMIEEPPPARYLQTTGFIASYYGTANVHGNDISPTGFEATRWGQTIVYFLGAYPSSIAPLDNYIPAPWVKGPQWALPASILAPDDPLSPETKTRPDLQPRTIWATFEATTQAIANHGGAWELMDRVLDPSDEDRPRFGRLTVSLYYRWTRCTGWDSLLMGSPTAELRNRTIRPTGIKPKPLGIPTIPHTVYIDVYSGIYQGGIGEAYLENQHRQIYPVGLAAPDFNEPLVDFYIRFLQANGWDSFTSTADHRLHPPEPIIPQGLDATLWGDSWTSNWLRNITPEGFDAGASGYTPGQFRDRMRVTRGTRTGVRPRSVPPGGAGTPTVIRISPLPHNDIFTAN